jgi:hypothetical protein
MCDADMARLAAYLDDRLPGWSVMWSPARRAFTAFGACTAESTIIEDPRADDLIDQMRDAQLAALAAVRPVKVGQ